jgi:hypothetical protein
MGSVFSSHPTKPTPSPVEQAHQKAVAKFVDALLKDDHINQVLIPDIIERKMYERVLSLVLYEIKAVLESTKIEFVGHTITIRISPKEEQQQDNTTTGVHQDVSL